MAGLDGPQPDWRSVPFDEAIAYFRDKVRLPTDAWTDLWEGMHARAFVVAGARNDALLADFQAALSKALTDGTTLEQFRRDFDQIVARYGWSYRGSRGWRSRVIFETNLNQARNAGRWAQAQRLKDRRPFLRYVHLTVDEPRLDHKSWHNLVLPVDDPWWDTHMPMNGWGCKCMVQSLSDDGVARLRREGEDIKTVAPPVAWQTRTVNTPSGPRTVKTPKGIDPGFAANPGRAAFGGAVRGGERFPPLSAPGDVNPLLTALVPRPSATPLGPRAAPGDLDQLRALLRTALGGDEAAILDPTGAYIAVGQGVADHIAADPKRQDGREAFFPFLRDIIESPTEIWAGFVVGDNGRVALRRRYVTVISTDKVRVLGLVLDAEGRMWAGLTFFRGKESALPGLRSGVLLYRDARFVEGTGAAEGD